MGKLVRCTNASELPLNIADITITNEGPDSEGKYMAWATSGTGDSYRVYFRTESVFEGGDAAETFLRRALERKTKR